MIIVIKFKLEILTVLYVYVVSDVLHKSAYYMCPLQIFVALSQSSFWAPKCYTVGRLTPVTDDENEQLDISSGVLLEKVGKFS